jgi:hypothetical protein
MTQEQQFVLDALRTAFRLNAGGMSAWKNASLDLNEAERIIVKNGILPTVYPVLESFPELQSKLLGRYYTIAAQTVKQDYEGNRILHAMNDAGIDCIALKGWELRKLYPEGVLRQMADIDILVRDYRYRQIEKLMAGLGFSAEGKTILMHDMFYKGSITAEIHKRLTDDSAEIKKWEKAMWKSAVPSDMGEHVFHMKDEDFYVFHLVHMHKDLLGGCLGLRRIADTWLILKAFPKLDRAYLDSVLGAMGLALFEERMVALSKAVMGETEVDANSATLLASAFRYGIYGTSEADKLSRAVAASGDHVDSAGIRAMIRIVFMPYPLMKAHFPALEKYPILLPWFWMVRILDKLKGDRNAIRGRLKKLDYRGLNEADYEEMKRFIDAGGCS